MRIRVFVAAAAVMCMAACADADATPPETPSTTSAATPTTDSLGIPIAKMISYRVYGGGTATITWYDGAGRTHEKADAQLPWDATYVPEGGHAGGGIYGVWVQDTSGDGETVTCEIRYGDKIIASNESQGPYATVECHGTT